MLRIIVTVTAAIALSINCFGQIESKVVVCDDGTVANYISEDNKEYTACLQDDFTVSKTKAHVVTYRASAGQGWVLNPNQNKVNVRNAPSKKGKIIGTLFTRKGYVPDPRPCLGLENGWMKIKYGNKKGYVRSELVKWVAINSY